MKKRFIFSLCVVLLAMAFSSLTQAAFLYYDLRTFTGEPMEMDLTINDNTPGFLSFQLTADPSSTGNIGDLRGFFFNLDPFAPTLTSADFIGSNITQVLISNDSIYKAGGGNTINPAGAYDVGIEIGTPGMSPDDIQSTTFWLSTLGGTLSLANLISETDDVGMLFAARFTSVGPLGSNRSGSSKISVVGVGPGNTPPPAPVPEPASLLLFGFGALGITTLIRKRKS